MCTSDRQDWKNTCVVYSFSATFASFSVFLSKDEHLCCVFMFWRVRFFHVFLSNMQHILLRFCCHALWRPRMRSKTSLKSRSFPFRTLSCTPYPIIFTYIKCNVTRCVTQMAVPWLRRSVAGLFPRRPGFDPRSVRVWFVLHKVALGQGLLPVFPFCRSVSFHSAPYSFIHPQIIKCLCTGITTATLQNYEMSPHLVVQNTADYWSLIGCVSEG